MATPDAAPPLPGFSLGAQGAEGRIWYGEYLGRPAVAKERFSKAYRHRKLDEMLTKQRTVAEARAFHRMGDIGVRAPKVYLTDVASGLVVMERLPGVTARQAIIEAHAAGDAARVEAVARAIGDMVARVHAAGFVHGDLTTSNMIVLAPEGGGEAAGGGSGAPAAAAGEAAAAAEAPPGGSASGAPRLALIDFGLSQRAKASQLLEERGVDLYVMERAFTSTHATCPEAFDATMEAYAGSGAWSAAKGPASAQSRDGTLSHLQRVRARGRKRMAFG
ncbi:hypothetical protein FNF27_00290 [Cafeteria roenbergensis]|uniref:non-specific serine/threonine protein kinase n=1 Tax=Cafeteria roenbergensis TaxID=33653 RepID=A0A5A8ERN7_CAFRO|nr:hypothetical protein FNF27_00290 [Cafeteria roenbergensis]